MSMVGENEDHMSQGDEDRRLSTLEKGGRFRGESQRLHGKPSSLCGVVCPKGYPLIPLVAFVLSWISVELNWLHGRNPTTAVWWDGRSQGDFTDCLFNNKRDSVIFPIIPTNTPYLSCSCWCHFALMWRESWMDPSFNHHSHWHLFCLQFWKLKIYGI